MSGKIRESFLWRKFRKLFPESDIWKIKKEQQEILKMAIRNIARGDNKSANNNLSRYSENANWISEEIINEFLKLIGKKLKEMEETRRKQ